MMLDLANSLKGQLHKNISLADYVSWRAGGPATQLYQPADQNDLAQFLQTLPADEKIIWIGLGSNLLIRDGGFKGTVILTQAALNELKTLENHLIYAQAGVSCAQLARYSARQSLSGIEFLAGVPGTVGGALAMNAGCHGGETWQHVHSVETMDRKGCVRQRLAQEFKVAYRQVVGELDEWFIGGYFQLTPGDKQISLNTIRELLDRRAATQPTNEPSCGSVFRNPAGDYAARLIEASGLKGYQIGGAMISPKHANFIVNAGQASASDIEQLIEYAASTVLQKFGISLQKEVHIIGEK